MQQKYRLQELNQIEAALHGKHLFQIKKGIIKISSPIRIENLLLYWRRLKTYLFNNLFTLIQQYIKNNVVTNETHGFISFETLYDYFLEKPLLLRVKLKSAWNLNQIFWNSQLSKVINCRSYCSRYSTVWF